MNCKTCPQTCTEPAAVFTDFVYTVCNHKLVDSRRESERIFTNFDN